MKHHDWLAFHAANTPLAPCWTDLASKRDFSFAEADARSRRLAANLARHAAVGRGDRVAVLAQNSTDILEIQAACAKIGAIFLPLNWRLAPPEIDFILSDCEPKVLIHDHESLPIVEALTFRLPARIATSGLGEASPFETLIAESDGDHPTPALDHADTWTLLYTSGTTGRPKGAPNTYGMAFINAVGLGMGSEITAKSVGITCMPLFHSAGLNCYASVLQHFGGRSLVMRSFEPGAALGLIDDPAFGVTHFFGVPAVYLFMSQHPDFEHTDFSRVLRCGVGGAPSPVPLVRTYLGKGIALTQGFGMTETSPLVCMQTPDQGRAKPGSAGRCALHSELRIVGPDGVEAGADELGELWVRGPNIMPGYWRRPEANKTDFFEGWFRTGDAARLDEDGDLWIVDRWKDMYISGGENVYPAEVESVLFGHEAIADAAIVGMPDERWGEVGVAVLVVRLGTAPTPEDIIAWCDGKLGRYKIPKRVVFVDELPRNATGKILKRVLRDRLS
jgi:fatty-acyl-CoA synthase